MIIKVLRRSTQGIIFIIALLIPVFDILRFDISALELYLFRQMWSFAPQGDYMSGAGGDAASFLFMGVMPWLLMFISLPVWGAVVGRFICGWFCAGGAMLEVGDYTKKQIHTLKELWVNKSDRANRQVVVKAVFNLLLVLVALLISCLFFSGYFLAPSRIWNELSSFNFSPQFIMIYSAMVISIVVTYVLAGHLFCSYICLAGLTQMLPAVASPFSLRIKFRQTKDSKCTNCRGCDKACFMEIKPRAQSRKVSPKCVNCGECIVACEKELGKNKVLSYGFGSSKK